MRNEFQVSSITIDGRYNKSLTTVTNNEMTVIEKNYLR